MTRNIQGVVTIRQLVEALMDLPDLEAPAKLALLINGVAFATYDIKFAKARQPIGATQPQQPMPPPQKTRATTIHTSSRRFSVFRNYTNGRPPIQVYANAQSDLGIGTVINRIGRHYMDLPPKILVLDIGQVLEYKCDHHRSYTITRLY